MKKRFLKIGLIVLGIVVFLIFAIYLPNLDAAFWEKQQVGQYMLVKQDKQEESIHYNLPLADKLSILSSQEGDFFCTEILIIHSITNLELEVSGILEGMQESLSQLENEKMIPKLKSEEDLRKSFDSAVYYNVSSTENTSVVVPVWKLTFYEEEEFYYQFLVDADTYQIYSVNVYGFGVYDFLQENGIFSETGKAWGTEDIGYRMGNQWKEYFKADDFQILYLEEVFYVEGMLSYWISESEETDTMYSSGEDFDGVILEMEIPCVWKYYSKEQSIDNMEGFSFSIRTGLGETEGSMSTVGSANTETFFANDTNVMLFTIRNDINYS